MPTDPMVMLFRVRMCHMPKEAEPSLLNKVGNWRTACRWCLVYMILRIYRDHLSEAALQKISKPYYFSVVINSCCQSLSENNRSGIDLKFTALHIRYRG